jgi:serine/threonine protein kinase
MRLIRDAIESYRRGEASEEELSDLIRDAIGNEPTQQAELAALLDSLCVNGAIDGSLVARLMASLGPTADADDAPMETRVRPFDAEETRTGTRDARIEAGQQVTQTRRHPAAVAPATPPVIAYPPEVAAFPEEELREVREPLATARAPARFGEGYRLRDRYLLEELIGQGAMGQVWRAKDLLGEEARDRNPYIAIKVLNSDFEGHPDAFVAMHREAARAQKLAHPNIVTVHVFDRDDQLGRAFIAMELLDGRPLDRVIRELRNEGLSRAEALPIIRGMAEGLAYAHRRGIVHADFKPANVFLTSDGTPKILDFGIAQAVQAADQAGAVAGADESIFQGYTPNYAAPETIAGEAPRPADDVFALGIVSYELLTGRHPFGRKPATEAQAARLVLHPIRGLKRHEWKAIERALTFDRAARWVDSGAFAKALQGIGRLQVTLAAAVAVLSVTAGVLWYRNYLATGPALPLDQLAPDQQVIVRDSLAEGQTALHLLKEQHVIEASADAAQSFATAYEVHKGNRDAVAGMKEAADAFIEWCVRQSDRQQARAQLIEFQKKSEFYRTYAPLNRAIERLESG